MKEFIVKLRDVFFTAIRAGFLTLFFWLLHKQLHAVPALSFWLCWVASVCWYYLVPDDGAQLRGINK